ncbi:PA3496 family putative envelope integrity protein [Leucothrix pacifica]|uniref:Uncharacterized protein n=1 Tax=Leucothrix pacifica TaxID=1247513 RepID=A0A317CB38_9GAMM|nr:hypothetical protein [Leucothrix pacifica]PWQ95768.1 hypothetical protein DKW60_13765 [Leucothrix pacifica]
MMTDNKQVLDSIFQATDDSIRVMDNKSKNGKENEKNKPKPHVLRRNIEDYLERKALERKLQDVFDDDYPLD